MYDGKLMNEGVRRFVEDGDVVIILAGTLMNDFNTGAFTAHLDPGRTIDIRHHHVSVDGMTYQSVEKHPRRPPRRPASPSSSDPAQHGRHRARRRNASASGPRSPSTPAPCSAPARSS
jgi:indolepyruvate decarboxylase